jgi:hypothetical protein
MKNQMRNRYQVNWTSTTRFRMALPARSGGGGGGGGGGAGGNGGVVMLVTSNLTPTSGVLGTLNEKYTITNGSETMVFQTYTSGSNQGMFAEGGARGNRGAGGQKGITGTLAHDGDDGDYGSVGRPGVAAVIFV